jgi:hypothetical protein
VAEDMKASGQPDIGFVDVTTYAASKMLGQHHCARYAD